MSVKIAFEELLSSLEVIYSKHGEIGDTAVREVIRYHMHYGLSKPVQVYKVNQNFKMFTEEANILLKVAFNQFFNHPAIVKFRIEQRSEEELCVICRDMNIEHDSPYRDLLSTLGLLDCLSLL